VPSTVNIEGFNQQGEHPVANELERLLFDVSREFCLGGVVRSAMPYGNGHINDTFLAETETEGRRYVFQRINDSIFQDVPRLMENIRRVCEHVTIAASRLPADIRQQPMVLMPAKSGGTFARDARGGYWRVYEYLEGTETIEQVEDVAHARESAKAFGVFLDMLRDLPGPRLHETIPHFHDTPKRIRDLEVAVDRDVAGRLSEVEAEVAFVRDHAEIADALTRRLKTGELPERITHNDTKINNIRFDCTTGKGAAVIDLDTVMPGLVHYDFGDMIRTTCFVGSEDERDLSTVRLRAEYVEAVYEGFLEGASGFLTDAEKSCLDLAGTIICLEIGVRFLTDYLEGDVYFKTHRPRQNLERARVQFRRVELLEA
jgi:hypothetical protein